MRGGRIVEHGLVQNIIARPTHPYTKELLACSPRLPPRKDNRGQP
ncbi:hypothetical protein [Brevundimonas sp.]